jgi:hypothetical protein
MIPRHKIKSLLKKAVLDVIFWIDYCFTRSGRIYRKQLAEFSKIAKKNNVPVIKAVRLYDNVQGQGLPYYSWEVHFATKVIVKEKIKKLVDIGSYVTWHPVISAVCELEVVDVRQVECPEGMFKSKQGDMGKLPYADSSLEALSSLCVIEHIGLARYGDPFGYDLDVTAAKELSRVIRPGGHLIISTNIGKRAVLFNAGRIYDGPTFISMFPGFEVRERLIYDLTNLKVISEQDAYAKPLGFLNNMVCFHLQKKFG